MAGEEINEDYPVEIHEYLSAFENSIGAKWDPLEQAKVDLASAYTLNSMFWVYSAIQGVNSKEHPVKQELERIIYEQMKLSLKKKKKKKKA
uniref:Nuclear nucleic acid-binding protein C1D n=1 Tax=Aotus nancymaae TaxID=37293 RepID=A0A2K5F4T9_AOTNA